MIRLRTVASLLVVSALAAAIGAPSALAKLHPARSCPATTGSGLAACHATYLADPDGKPHATTAPTGLAPADLQSAYNLPSAIAGAGRTIAIVDAYDNPNAEADLAVYRSTFGLGPCTSAGATPCLRKVNKSGGSKLPHGNASWGQEINLDLDMASAVCPRCRILLVEASSARMADLAAAENTAALLGASAISNSWGGAEWAGELDATVDGAFVHPGISITASSGDSGYGTSYPAASANVVAVGGTSLARAAGTARGWSETTWAGAGSGCSALVPKPAWQIDAACANRAIADVSAVADPATGVSVYDSYAFQGMKGWMRFGGTSVSAPIVAGVFALAGDGGSAVQLYAAPAGSLNDVTSGSNGACGGSYLCTAGAGYDGPTGLGTPWGTTAF